MTKHAIIFSVCFVMSVVACALIPALAVILACIALFGSMAASLCMFAGLAKHLTKHRERPTPYTTVDSPHTAALSLLGGILLGIIVGTFLF